MDSHKRSTRLERLEVVEAGRRRRWSDDEQLRIVAESFQAREPGGFRFELNRIKFVFGGQDPDQSLDL
jgi:hypothetical protein